MVDGENVCLDNVKSVTSSSRCESGMELESLSAIRQRNVDEDPVEYTNGVTNPGCSYFDCLRIPKVNAEDWGVIEACLIDFVNQFQKLRSKRILIRGPHPLLRREPDEVYIIELVRWLGSKGVG